KRAKGAGKSTSRTPAASPQPTSTTATGCPSAPGSRGRRSSRKRNPRSSSGRAQYAKCTKAAASSSRCLPRRLEHEQVGIRSSHAGAAVDAAHFGDRRGGGGARAHVVLDARARVL